VETRKKISSRNAMSAIDPALISGKALLAIIYVLTIIKLNLHYNYFTERYTSSTIILNKATPASINVAVNPAPTNLSVAAVGGTSTCTLGNGSEEARRYDTRISTTAIPRITRKLFNVLVLAKIFITLKSIVISVAIAKRTIHQIIARFVNLFSTIVVTGEVLFPPKKYNMAITTDNPSSK